MDAEPDAVREALAESAKVGPFFALSVGNNAEGWRPAADVYSGGLRDLIEATGERLGVSEVRVAASTAHLGYAAHLWSPVLHCALRHGVGLDLTGLRLATSPSMRLNLPDPRGWRLNDPDELAALAYRMVIGRHLEPLRRGLRVKIAAGVLHGNAAAAMTAALRVLAATDPGLGRPARDLAEALLAIGVLSGTGELTGPGLEFRRRSCCLFYRVPGGGLCGDCPLPARA
jgi:hypothetical protein